MFLGGRVVEYDGVLNDPKTFAHVFKELHVYIVVQVGETDFFWLYWKHIVFVHLADFVEITRCNLIRNVM